MSSKTIIEAVLQIDKAVQARSNNIGIWKDGCIEILEVMLKRDLIEYPFAWIYIGVGLILALVELITVVLACAYIAQINRSRKFDQVYSCSNNNVFFFSANVNQVKAFHANCCRRQRHQRMYTRAATADDDGTKYMPGGEKSNKKQKLKISSEANRNQSVASLGQYLSTEPGDTICFDCKFGH